MQLNPFLCVRNLATTKDNVLGILTQCSMLIFGHQVWVLRNKLKLVSFSKKQRSLWYDMMQHICLTLIVTSKSSCPC